MAIRILIVEDDPHTRRILEAVFPRDATLAASGTEVVAVDDGEQALRALDRQPFDLIITDLVMPRMDGFELARAVRQHTNGKRVPLIVTSGIFIRPSDAAQLNTLRDETGAQFFAKPFQLQELLGAVLRLLGLTPLPAVDKTALGRVALKKASSSVSLTSGSLEERSLADLILDLVAGKASGTLKLTRGQVKKEIHFSHGTPIAARSNVRQETLGHFLVARGLLSEQLHQEALSRAHERDERLGRALLELGWLSEDDLLRQLAAQFRARVVAALRWNSGAWTFAAGEPPGDLLPTPVDGVRLVLAGLGRTAQPDEVAHRYADSRGKLRLTKRGERHADTIARVFGPTVCELFRDTPRIESVVAAPELLPSLDALMGAGFVELELLDSPAPAATITVDAKPESGARTLYEELFSDDISEVYGPAPPAPPTETKPARDVAADATLRRELLAAYLDIQGADAYAALGVQRGATVAEIDAAFSAAMTRFSFERFAGVDLGRDYQTLEVVQEQLKTAHRTLTSPDRRTALDAALKSPSRQLTSMEADLRAREALQLLERTDYNGARAAVQKAVTAAPDQADYHALLAWCTYLADGGMEPDGTLRQDALAAAMPHLEEAFWIDPDCVEAHHRAAQLALVGNDENRALVHLEEVLDRAPLRQPGDASALLDEALDAVKDLCMRRGDYMRLERRYRKQLHRVNKDALRCLPLWLELGALYRDRLANRDAAAEAFSTAHSLAPADPRPTAALATLRDDRPAGATVEELRAAWRAAPGSAEPGLRLYQMHIAAGAWDGALQAASVLVAREQADDDAKAFARRYRPRFLARIAEPLDAVQLRHPDENDALTSLFAKVLTGRLRPEPGDETIECAALPDAFRRVLMHATQVFGGETPTVVRRADLGGEVHAAPGQLVVGPLALSSDDKTDLAFRVGRALVWLGDGRAAAAAVGSRRLRTLLYAAMTMARPDLLAPDADGEIAKERARIEADSGLRDRLLPDLERLLGAKDAQISLSRHLRGLGRTADRAALVVCGDVLIAAAALRVEGDPEALDDLLDFAISDQHLAARERLGLSVAV